MLALSPLVLLVPPRRTHPPCTFTSPSAMHFSTKTNTSLCGRRLDFGVLGTPNLRNGEFLTQIRVGGEFLTQVPIAAAHGCSSCLQQIVRLQEIVQRSTGTTLQLMEYLPFAMSCSTTGKE